MSDQDDKSIWQIWLDEGQRLRDLDNCRHPIFRAFKWNGCDDPVFDMWWYKLPLWKKIQYKIRMWF